MTALPEYVRALLRFLSGGSASVTEPEWRQLLAFADRNGCTLFLRGRPGLPEWLQNEIEARWERNARRRTRLLQEYQAVAGALQSAGVPFVVLKGYTHEAGWGIDGRARIQYDLDLLCSPQAVVQASAALAGLGYRPHGSKELSELHGRPLVLPSAWQWTGDYYDPAMPIPIELHTTLWSGERDRLPLRAPTDGREWIEVEGLRVPALARVDVLGFAALHCLRHLLHHNVRLSHFVELARMLETAPPDLWTAWEQQDERIKRFEAAAFRCASVWFDAPLPDAVRRSASPAVDRWFATHVDAPLLNAISPNKNAVWLHTALLEGRWDRLQVLAATLLPAKLPPPGRWRERAWYHLRAGLGLWRKTASDTASDNASDTSR